MSPVASALASITGSCNCGTNTVVMSRTRSVHAASAPSSARASGLSNAIRSPQHRDENGPSSIVLAQSSRIGASRSGSITGIVIPTCTTAIVARRPGLTRTGSMRVMPITTTSVQHIRLTVTDITRSRAFYEGVFGWPVALEVPAGADAEIREKLWFLYEGVLYRAGEMLVGLRPVANDRFDENRAGLDHLAFLVSTKAELDAAAAHLDELGVAHEPVKDIGTSH